MIAWALNLDADHELRKPLGYLPNKRVLARVAQMQNKLVALLAADDVVVSDGVVDGTPTGLCWCPTPTALARLERTGARPAPTPPFELVRRVNHRRFNVELGVTLEHCRFIEDDATLRAAITSGSPTGQWVMKRPFSIAGSGRRVLRSGVLEAHDEPWVTATLGEGGLVLEPWVDKAGELVVHGYVHRGGGAVIGDPCVQVVDDYGGWVDTFRGDIDPSDESTMRDTASEVASALEAEGYFGPFGVDAFRFRRGDDIVLNRRGEINARYTMGWAIGMRSQRPDRGDH